MKKIIALLLVVALMASFAISASAFSTFDEGAEKMSDAFAAFEAESGTKIPTYRYYILQPDGKSGLLGDDPTSGYEGKYAPSWYKEGYEGTVPACYYWQTSEDYPTQATWVGYMVDGKVDGTDNVYYVDCPQDVKTIVWNNGIDGGMDTTQPIYYCACQSSNVGSEYYDPGEAPHIPDGTPNFNNMIWVVDPDLVDINEYSEKQTCGGFWWYYYGGSCFGADPNGAEDLENCCCNAAHDHSAPQYILGDANDDGEVSVVDATCIQKVLAQINVPSYNELAADVNGDGSVDVVDATTIQKFLAQMTNIDGSKPYDPEYPLNPKS